MTPQSLITIVVFGPLLGAIVAGLFGRRIGNMASQTLTTGLLILAAVLSWTIFS